MTSWQHHKTKQDRCMQNTIKREEDGERDGGQELFLKPTKQ